MTLRLPVSYDATCTQTHARALTLHTRRGDVRTPIFMPVGTVGSVKGVAAWELRDLGVEIILGNTYHLYLRPGTDTLERYGGLHKFMGWDGPILTDSGGYQFFSLRELCRFRDDGVAFASHLDGSRHVFTPERVIEIQAKIGSEIMMVLDQCPPLPSTAETLAASVARTTTWAKRSLTAAEGYPNAVFAIVQGGTDVPRRQAHLAELAALPFDGYALGGLAVGESPDEMYQTLESVAPTMPSNKPRYLMGVGRPTDILTAIRHGIDMFDCVMPTRNARNGGVFWRGGTLNMRNAKHIGSDEPIDPDCMCPACSRVSRGYLHHLLRTKELLGLQLLTMHNIKYYLDLVRGARAAIANGRYDVYEAACRVGWEQGG